MIEMIVLKGSVFLGGRKDEGIVIWGMEVLNLVLDCYIVGYFFFVIFVGS